MVSDPAIGRVVGAYRLIAPLGEGGMATVYRAEHTAIGKEVAIKILKPGLAKQPEMVLRFFHEARSVNQVRHENLIDILDYGETPNKEHYIVMELLDGEPLSHVIKTQAPLPLRRLGHIGLQICSALDAVHQKGIIHRDLKGSNIFLTTRAGQKDFVKILDFGIAKLPKTQELPEELKTVTGAMMGTPMFMSPEQGKGLEVDQQTDIYALGVLLYQLATGVPPFYNESLRQRWRRPLCPRERGALCWGLPPRSWPLASSSCCSTHPPTAMVGLPSPLLTRLPRKSLPPPLRYSLRRQRQPRSL